MQLCHYLAMLLHILAPALLSDRGWPPLEIYRLHRAARQFSPQHPWQLSKVQSHHLVGSNRSVFYSFVSQGALDAADLLPVPTGADVYHKEQNEQPS